MTVTYIMRVSRAHCTSQSWIIITRGRSTSAVAGASINVIKVTLLPTEQLPDDYRYYYWSADRSRHYPRRRNVPLIIVSRTITVPPIDRVPPDLHNLCPPARVSSSSTANREENHRGESQGAERKGGKDRCRLARMLFAGWRIHSRHSRIFPLLGKHVPACI